MKSRKPLISDSGQAVKPFDVSETQLQAVFDNTPVCMNLKDTEGRYLLVNKPYEDWLGRSAEEIIGRKASEFLTSETEVEGLSAAENIVLETGKAIEREVSVERPDGRIYHRILIKYPVKGTDGSIGAIGTVAIDVTDRKEIEDELKELNEQLENRIQERIKDVREIEGRYRHAFENAPIGVALITPEGNRFQVNQALADFLGYSIDELTDTAMTTTAGDTDDLDKSMVLRQKVLDGEIDVYRNERRYRHKDGHIIWGEVTGALYRNPKGEPEHFIAHTIDITERKKAEDALRQAQKMEAVGQLTGGVAHDFNNLLHVIMGNTQLLEAQLGQDDTALAAILRATQRGAELTQRLLAFSRQQSLKPQVIDLGALLLGTTEMLRRTLGETIEIKTVVDPNLKNALADPGQLEVALLNLALNARDAMPGGGRLTILCQNDILDKAYMEENSETASRDCVTLSVSDEGCGMTTEVQAHAFEPFFTTKEVGQGSGLGLSMVYGFAKQSGGHVNIYSEEGKGTTIKLYLPRAEAAAPSKDMSSQEDTPPGRGEMVLVIEDDPEVRDLAVRMLKCIGYRVIDACDVATARNVLAEAGPVDLVLSDVVLPGGTGGPEFAEELRMTHPDVKIIFMSGYPAEAAKRNGFLGSDQVLLNKPFQMRQLAKALREALG